MILSQIPANYQPKPKHKLKPEPDSQFNLGLFFLHTFSLYQNAVLSSILLPPVEVPPEFKMRDLVPWIRQGSIRINFRNRQSIFNEQFRLLSNDSSSLHDIRDALEKNRPMYVDGDVKFDENGSTLVTMFSSELDALSTVSLANCDMFLFPFPNATINQMAVPVSPWIAPDLLRRLNSAILADMQRIANIQVND